MTGLNIRYSTRAKVLVTLLVLSFVFMCALAWQAFQSTTQHREIANKVVSEYAMLAAEEFARRIMADIGYRGYFQLLSQWQELSKTTTANDFPKPSQEPLCQGNHFASYFFTRRSNEITIVDERCENRSNLSIQKHVQAFDLNRLEDKPFAFIHTIENSKPISIVVSKQSGDNLIGFVVNRKQLISALNNTFNKSPLLPSVLADGQASNELLNIHMSDHSGSTLIGKFYNGYDYIASSKTLQDEYSGIFENYTINVAIHTSNANQLIIGGFPKNNLPLLLLTIVTTLLVFISSLLQLKKEHQLNQLRESFVAEVSHELRTPLTQIRLFAEMLLHRRTRNAEEFQNYLEIINRETLRLNHLINNLLKYSESQQFNKLQFSQISIAKLIDEVVADYTLLLKQRKSKIDVKLDDCFLTLDPEATKRVISNLLDNALKYGPENQTITIKSQLIESLGTANYRLFIDDQGPGIPDKQKKSVWRPYFRLPRESKAAIAGTGIGLYLVKQLVHKMSAQIWIEDNQYGGCRFVLEWPFTEAKET